MAFLNENKRSDKFVEIRHGGLGKTYYVLVYSLYLFWLPPICYDVFANFIFASGGFAMAYLLAGRLASGRLASGGFARA